MKFTTTLLALTHLALFVAASPVAAPENALGEPVFIDEDAVSDLESRQAKKRPYVNAVLKTHNAHRANHSAAALTWSKPMTANAKVLAERCVFAHDTSIGGGGYGQNLAAGSGWSRDKIADVITGGWYDELPFFAGQYGKPTPDMSTFGSYGHFTQVVWKDSKAVGCVTFDCSTKGGLKDSSGNVLKGLNWYTVCNYSPPGNYLGEFATNVGRPLGRPSI